MLSESGPLPPSAIPDSDPLQARRVATDHGRNLACWSTAGIAITMIKNARLSPKAIKELDLEAEKFTEELENIRKH